MSPVSIVTDSTHYLPRELVADRGVQEVSLYVSSQGGTVRESDIDDYGAFYEELRSSDSLPTTSQPSIGDFLAVYEPLLDAGQDIVSLHISGGISGTVESARQAATEALRERPDRRIEVVDTGSAAGGMGLIVLAAEAAARGGADVAGGVVRSGDAMRSSKIWFAVDTLEYLRRGGRIGTAQAWVGGALKIKPILTLRDEIVPIERVRTSGRAFERLYEYLQSRQSDGATGWAVQHIQALDQAERMVDRGRELFGTEPEFVSEIGSVIGAHAGPGLLGVAGVDPELLR
ncbi:MAG: fatty acid kinase fatty acid binding subunit [Solirubrobacteraceae bacterium]|nr:fatty acid kinase fatty acid binding subunit [Solirubrobacteraceae bacterium]